MKCAGSSLPSWSTANFAFALCLGLVACSEESKDADAKGASTDSPSGTSSGSAPGASGPELGSDAGPLFTAVPPVVSVTASASPSAPNPEDSYLQTCTPGKGLGQDGKIDDFEDGDIDLSEIEGRSGSWFLYQENTGDHQRGIVELSAARLESHWALHTSGTDHGAWAGIGTTLTECVYDASKYVGLHFWLKGTASPLRVALTTPGVVPVSEGGTCTEEESGGCWDAYRVDLEVEPGWKEYFIPFSDFEQLGYGQDAGELDLTRVRTIEFQSEAAAFDYMLDDIGFYIEEVYTPFDAGADPGSPTQPDAGMPEPLDAASVQSDAAGEPL